MMFMMVLLLPVASYLSMPSGHTPNTLPKYVSIVAALPRNLIQRPVNDVFPGFAIVVLISVALMVWGSMKLGTKKGLLLAAGGLLLYTLSPTIASTIMGSARLRILPSFFNIGYYLAWLGLVVVAISPLLPRWLKVKSPAAGRTAGVLSIIAPVAVLGLMERLGAKDPSGGVMALQLLDFESTHHAVAGGFAGAFAGFGGAAVVDEAVEAGEAEETEEAEPEKAEHPRGPQPYSGEDVPEGSTIEYLPDGRVVVRTPDGLVATKHPDGTMTGQYPDGTVTTEYSDGTVYGQYPDGSIVVEYPDGTTKEWSPDGYSSTKNPDGTFETINPDGSKSSFVKNEDGSMTAKSGYGGELYFPKDGYPTGSFTAKDGMVISMDGSGGVRLDCPNGDFVTMNADGKFSGTVSDAEGNRVTFNADGSVEATTAEGDRLTIDAEGIKGALANGSTFNFDPDGNLIRAHIKDSEGTVDYQTDNKGGVHISDDKGNSAHINPDGSGEMRDAEGNVMSQDSEGNASISNAQGARYTVRTDGSESLEDGQGGRVDMASNGMLTVTEAGGRSATYTPEQAEKLGLLERGE
jgi:hypothetical protein